MGISVTCAQCSASFVAKDELAGRRGRCPRCQAVITVPGVAAVKMPAAAAAPSTLKKSAPAPSADAGPPAVAPRKQTSAAEKAPAGRVSPAAVNTVAARKKAPAQPADLQQAVLQAFQGAIAPVRVAWSYRVAALLATVIMVLLPVLYVVLIIVAGWLVYLHAVHDTWLIGMGRGRAMIFSFLAYAAPLIAGAILVLFMIKPLFARPEKIDRRRSLSRGGEPLLFAFVDRLCEAVHAPKPERIDVNCEINASAGFRRGLLSFLGNDLVLTIGLPLVAGLNATQFAGVLAHEFGHFTQGAGMRLSYIVRSINFWFVRVVYERDQWDAALVEWSEESDVRVGFIFYLARFFVWLSRGVLWFLMMVGHATTGLLMRQMEYDADRHEVRLAGTKAFVTTTRQLHVLEVASRGAYADLAQFAQQGRLGDNLPKLIVANVPQIPGKLMEVVEKHIREARTGMLDTHPAPADRIRQAERENSPGLFHVDRPASILFTDFDALCRNVTWDNYRDIFGGRLKLSDLHPIDELLAAAQAPADTRSVASQPEEELPPIPLA